MSSEFDQLLQGLSGTEAGAPSARQLRLLSDLSHSQREQLRGAWGQALPALRRKVVQRLIKLAEDHIELNFHAVLRVCLEDADDQVRSQAVDGLWECQALELVPAFLRLLADDGSAQVRAAAARGLGQFLLLSELGEINPSVGLSVERALWTTIQRSGEELEVRRQALQSIAYSSEAGIVDLIEQTYRHEDPAMRVSAVFAMGRNADAAWRPLVQRELSSADPAMRREAARASGELEDRQAVPALIRLVQDDDSEVRLAAIEALGQIGGSPARRLLEKLLQEGDDDEKSAVEEALEMLYFHSGIDIPLFASWGELADDEDDWLEEDE